MNVTYIDISAKQNDKLDNMQNLSMKVFIIAVINAVIKPKQNTNLINIQNHRMKVFYIAVNNAV